MLGEAAALAASACWAVGSHLFGRVARQGDIPPGAMNLGKCVTAGSLFTLTCLVLRGSIVPAVAPRAAAWLAVSGLVGLALGDFAYFGALVHIGVRRALLLLSTAPVWTAIGGALFLDEPLTLRDATAIVAAMVGVAVVVNEEELSAREEAPTVVRAAPPAKGRGRKTVVRGVLLGLGSGLGQAVGSLFSRFAMRGGVAALDASLVRLAAGVSGILLLGALSGQLASWTRALASPGRFGAVAGSAVVGSYVGIWLAQFAIGNASSTAIAGTLLATSPLFALPLGRWLNEERITVRALGGTLVACAGLGVLTLGAR